VRFAYLNDGAVEFDRLLDSRTRIYWGESVIEYLSSKAM
jgi:hypothetical protein